MVKCLICVFVRLKSLIATGSAGAVLLLMLSTVLAQRPELVVQSGHGSWVFAVAFSPDGRLLASGSGDQTIKLWDVATGTELRSLRGHTYTVQSVAFSPDGKLLVSLSGDNEIKLWDVFKGTVRWTIKSESHMNAIAFSPDGLAVASGGNNGLIKLWNVATGQETRALKTGSHINSLAFNPDGNQIAASDNDTISILNSASGSVIRTIKDQAHRPNAVIFSHDGRTIASGGYEEIKLWDVDTGLEVRTLKGHASHVKAIAFSRDGARLASGNYLGTIKLWDVTTGAELSSIEAHAGEIHSVAFSPDGEQLASGGSDETIKFWRTSTGSELRTIRGVPTSIFSGSFNLDDRMIFSGTSGNAVKLWDLVRGELRTLTGHQAAVFSSVFSPDGRVLASAGTDNSIRLWDVGTGAELHTLEWRFGVIASLAFSPDGKIIAGASADHYITLWEVSSGKRLGQLEGHRGSINSLAFSPNGRTLASGSYKEVKLWDLETHKELRTLPGHFNNVNTIVFSPDGRMLASDSFSELYVWDTASGAKLQTIRANNNRICTFSADGKTVFSGTITNEIKEWEVSTGKELRTFKGHTSAPLAITFSSDRRLMASGSVDNTIKLWDAETGLALHTLSGHAGHVLSVGFTSDNRLLVSAGDDGAVKIWAIDSGKELATLIATGERDWLVITPDGLFDGSGAAWKQVVWRFNNESLDHAPVEAFFNEFFYPGLLSDLLSGKRPQASQSLSNKDRRQPQLKLEVPDSATRNVQVTIAIAEAPADQRQQMGSGARDVRLFRNGTLVKLWRGNAFELGDRDGCKQQGQGKAVCIATVTLVAGENELLAYAFNNDNVKSADETQSVHGAGDLTRRGTAYVLAVGVDKYANPDYDLRYAVADAREFGLEIKRQQELLNSYERVEVVPLYDREATKENILLALNRLSGSQPKAGGRRSPPKAIGRIGKAEPEDLVMIYFAGHGTAHEDRFYLIPHDLGYEGSRRISSQRALQMVLSRSISDRELEAAFEKIDARYLLLIVDACNSGQALEAEEKRRGPMNSRGLAQLAYEKGMYILTAAQSYQAALEVAQLGHGLLTYALIEEGLRKNSADRDGNGRITQREWLDYPAERVPQLQLEKMKQRELDIKQGPNDGERAKLVFVAGDERIADPAKRSLQRPRVFYRRELEARPLVIAAGQF